MTITGMKQTIAERRKPDAGSGITEALALNAARIMPHVMLPALLEMELAQEAMAETLRREQPLEN